MGFNFWEIVGLECVVFVGKSLIVVVWFVVEWIDGDVKYQDIVLFIICFGVEDVVKVMSLEVDWQML